MHSLTQKIWYFAYGSNMSKEVLTGHRGIRPIISARVYLPNWVLEMEIHGMPYSEPSYGSIRRRHTSDLEKSTQPDVAGVAYLITLEQYHRIIASEGGQIAYADVLVLGKPLGPQDLVKTGPELRVRTLASTGFVRHPPPSPSSRYMKLLIAGAKESELPESYLAYLARVPYFIPSTQKWPKLGAFIFLQLTKPLWELMSRLTHANTREDGSVPKYVVCVVRTTIFKIWLLHDVVFAPIFGRGDGRQVEKVPLPCMQISMSDGFPQYDSKI